MKMVVFKVTYLAGQFIIFYYYYNGILYVKQFDTSTGLAVVAQYAFAAYAVRFGVDKLKRGRVGKLFFGGSFVFGYVFICNLYYGRAIGFVEKLCLCQPVLHQLVKHLFFYRFVSF